MGIRIAGINVSKIIKKEIGDNTLKDPAHDVVLISFAPGSRTGNNTGGKNRTSSNIPGKGFIDSTNIKSVKGTLVVDGDYVIQLVGDSLIVGTLLIPPKIDDHVTIESTRFRIKILDSDPANAMYTCLCREV